MGHVLARLAGYGVVLVPYWPYTFERSDAASDAVVVTNWRVNGPAKALVDSADAHSAPGIVDVEPGPDHPFWVIETSSFSAVWPFGFSVESTVAPYCLVGEHDASISVQGPVHIADPDVMIAPGQTVVGRRKMGRDVEVIELVYEHEGEPWWQGVYLYPRKGGQELVFTAQSREPGIAAARDGVEWMLALS
ncbi:hypothetical protein [Micromonospora sp. HK10]|uniref:hypothetical protein n=1 Tax=Micromonospora sp. HK10 TaxID=1538294 RepID=UPI000A815973|nr:hypothetical protein [Micromonospora sp. HK10]